MAELARLQADFAAAILGPDADVGGLGGRVEGDGIPAPLRLNVYRNNFRQGLGTALAEIFPVVQAFVGPAFLKAALRHFVVAYPPSEPMLYGYGAGFADFLDHFPPAAQVPYVADVARVEWAMHELQNAVEEGVLTTSALPEAGRVRLSGNVRLVVSRYPVASLWMAGTGQLPPEAVNPDAGGQTAAIVLSDMEIRLLPLEGGIKTLAETLWRDEEPDAAQLVHLPALAGRGMLTDGETQA
ncbi:MAG: DUF2063 domain-containing protein [Alphaproteobacteria bacterium]|nr:MAG: DUF2063 domain-containing protein [Alphaproteobacteria bacterium]